MRIAVLDNDRSLLESLRIILSRMGHHVDCFASPREALDHLEDGDDLDAILVDLVMPDMTGIEFLAQAGPRLGGRCRKAIITGHAEKLNRRDLAQAGIDALFAKPLDLAALSEFLVATPVRGTQRETASTLVLVGLMAVWYATAPAAHADEPAAAAFPQHTPSLHAPASGPGGVPDLSEGASLRDYLLVAAGNNPGLRAAFERWRAAMARIAQARALPDPKLTYTYYIQEVETRVGPQRQRFSLSQMFPWFGTLRLRGEAAAKGAEAAWFDLEAKRLALFHRVSLLYYDHYYLARAVAVTQENFDLLKSLEQVARERYRTGHALAAVMQIQVELAKLDDRLRSLEALRPALAGKLNAAMDRPAAAPLPQPDRLPATWPEPRELADIIADAPELNPGLNRLSAMAEKEAIAVELARRKAFPDITFGLSVIDTGAALMSGTGDSGKDPVMATIGINLPIWRGKYSAARQEALHRERAWLEQKRDRTNALSADVQLALYHYEDATRKISLYRNTLVPMAKQALGVAQQAFQTGKADFLTLIDAQRMLLELELAGAEAQADRGKRFAEFQMLVGASARRQQPEPPR